MTSTAPRPLGSPAPGGRPRSWLARRRQQRRDEQADALAADRLLWAWREAAEGAGIGRTTDTPTGPIVSTPHVTAVVLGPPTTLIVRLLPGQLVADLRRAAPRLAGHLGAAAVRIEPRGLAWAKVTLLDRDPLAGRVPLRLLDDDAVLIGVTEAGPLRVTPAELPHVIVQGQTRSGKRTWLYGLLAQLAGRLDVEIAGVDPTGLTLRPFADTRHAARQVCGLGDLARVEKVLAELVAELDRRLDAMPAAVDVLPVDERTPLIVVVLDEWPATLRALDAASSTKDPAGKRVRALVARLLAESHKVGMRVVIAAQRAEATIVGAAGRAQCAGRLSFRVDSADSVRLLHSDADDLAAGHSTAEPGIALLSWPNLPLVRMRAPYLGPYAAFVDAVQKAER